jgi:hypothetical protein
MSTVLNNFGASVYSVGSALASHVPTMEQVSSFGKDVATGLVSSGMSQVTNMMSGLFIASGMTVASRYCATRASQSNSLLAKAGFYTLGLAYLGAACGMVVLQVLDLKEIGATATRDAQMREAALARETQIQLCNGIKVEIDAVHKKFSDIPVNPVFSNLEENVGAKIAYYKGRVNAREHYLSPLVHDYYNQDCPSLTGPV